MFYSFYWTLLNPGTWNIYHLLFLDARLLYRWFYMANAINSWIVRFWLIWTKICKIQDVWENIEILILHICIYKYYLQHMWLFFYLSSLKIFYHWKLSKKNSNENFSLSCNFYSLFRSVFSIIRDWIICAYNMFSSL